MHNNDTTTQLGALRSIVVGVDPSPTAKRALSTAIVTARRFGVGCHVVHSWAYPMMAMTGPFAPTAARWTSARRSTSGSRASWAAPTPTAST
ncbi:MAG: hypothetical protein NVSMB16_10050 [Acidimicrobiales bacterium]